MNRWSNGLFFNKILMDEILPYNLTNQLNIFVIGFLILGLTQIILSTIRTRMLLYLSQKIDIPLLVGGLSQTECGTLDGVAESIDKDATIDKESGNLVF